MSIVDFNENSLNMTRNTHHFIVFHLFLHLNHVYV